MQRRTITLIAGLAIAALIFAPGASAQDSSERGYGGAGGEVQAQVSGGDTGPQGRGGGTADSVGGLPFTGLDLAAALGGGLLLLGAGIVLSRFVARETAA